MGSASAYAAVLRAIEQDVGTLRAANPNLFTFTNTANGMVDVRDFQTTGVVAFARGLPFSSGIPSFFPLDFNELGVGSDQPLCISAEASAPIDFKEW
jgi:hypothetical protein